MIAKKTLRVSEELSNIVLYYIVLLSFSNTYFLFYCALHSPRLCTCTVHNHASPACLLPRYRTRLVGRLKITNIKKLTLSVWLTESPHIILPAPGPATPITQLKRRENEQKKIMAPKFNSDHPLIPHSKRTARQIIGKIKTSDLNWLTVQCFHHHRLSVKKRHKGRKKASWNPGGKPLPTRLSPHPQSLIPSSQGLPDGPTPLAPSAPASRTCGVPGSDTPDKVARTPYLHAPLIPLPRSPGT